MIFVCSKYVNCWSFALMCNTIYLWHISSPPSISFSIYSFKRLQKQIISDTFLFKCHGGNEIIESTHLFNLVALYFGKFCSLLHCSKSTESPHRKLGSGDLRPYILEQGLIFEIKNRKALVYCTKELELSTHFLKVNWIRAYLSLTSLINHHTTNYCSVIFLPS
jgi:hypothetical protein